MELKRSARDSLILRQIARFFFSFPSWSREAFRRAWPANKQLAVCFEGVRGIKKGLNGFPDLASLEPESLVMT